MDQIFDLIEVLQRIDHILGLHDVLARSNIQLLKLIKILNNLGFIFDLLSNREVLRQLELVFKIPDLSLTGI